MSMPQPWKIISSQLAFDHRWYKVRQDVVCLPNGKIVDDYFVSVCSDAAKLDFLSVLYDNPVKETSRIHLFLAENAYRVGDQCLDETEDIEVVLLSIDDIFQHINDGHIQVPGTLTALYMGLNRRSA